jgi:hypothetical protein
LILRRIAPGVAKDVGVAAVPVDPTKVLIGVEYILVAAVGNAVEVSRFDGVGFD